MYLKTTVLEKLESDDHIRLMELMAADYALPMDYNRELYDIAKRVKLDLMIFKARMIEKYIGTTEDQLQDLFGDYGYSFDAEAGVIYRDDS
jgi:hypothetical protein